MNILLAVDGSAYSLAAAAAIAHRPWPPGSAVKILCVVKLPFAPTAETRTLPDSEYSQLESAAMQQAQEAVDAAHARLKASHGAQGTPLTITMDIQLGQPQDVILTQAEQGGADLIMLGSRGLGGFQRFLLGSVSSAVATHAPCSVEVVRLDEAHPIGAPGLKILLAVDGSSSSNAAVREVARCLWPLGSTVKIIGVAEPAKPLTPELWLLPNTYYQEGEKQLEEQVRATVAQAAAQFASPTLTILQEVGKGQVRNVLLTDAENWGADLIVLGSRGLGGVKRLLLGSVSSAVLSHAACSVRIVRERPAA